MVYNEKRGSGIMHDHDFDYGRIAELRSRFVPDQAVVDAVQPSSGDVIVDIGAGEGHYSELFARTASHVYSVDRSHKAVELVKSRIERNSIPNLTASHEEVCSGFTPEGFNKVFFGTSFHDIPCQDKLIRTLVQKGTEDLILILLEFKKEDTIGPPLEIRISQKELEDYMKRMGFRKIYSKELEIHYIHSYSKG